MPQQLTQEESKDLAKHIVDALVMKLTDEEVVKTLTSVWGKQLDQWIGHGVRKLALYLFITVVVAAAIKFHIWDSLFK